MEYKFFFCTSTRIDVKKLITSIQSVPILNIVIHYSIHEIIVHHNSSIFHSFSSLFTSDFQLQENKRLDMLEEWNDISYFSDARVVQLPSE